MRLSQAIFLLLLANICMRDAVSALHAANRTAGRVARSTDSFYESAQCSNLETDAHYLDHVIMYKDSVESIGECCQFCNLNPACNVWSLQRDFKRCFLKSARGARLGDTAYISGFSDKCRRHTKRKKKQKKFN